MFWLETSLAMKPSSRRAASFEYSGSSAISEAAVWMESRSSSLVVAPLYRPPMVLLATRIALTESSPAQQRSTARTILLTSAGSSAPLRLRTCICDALCCDEETGNATAGCAVEVSTRTGVAMTMPFPPKRDGNADEMEKKKTPVHREPPLGGLQIFRAGIGAAAGRSSD